MQKVSQRLAPLFVTRSPYNKASITRDIYEVIEFYPATHMPALHDLGVDGTYFGFDPADAAYRFTSSGAEWLGNSYRREVVSRGDITRYLTSQFNEVQLTFSNVSRFFTNLVQTTRIEGMWVVIRELSRSRSATLKDSAILFTGRLDKPSDITRKACTIRAKQRIATIEQEIPFRKFIVQCPLEFKGFGCTGNVPAEAHTLAWQNALLCNKSFAQCTEYGNTDFFQGYRFVAQAGTFPVVTTQTKTFLWIFKKKKTVITTGQWSSKDSTPYDTPVPVAIGRVRVDSIPIVGVDAGNSVNGLFVFTEGKIADIIELMTPTAGYSQPLFVVKHLGDWGGTGTNNGGDYSFTGTGKFSKTAYVQADFWAGTTETQSDVPQLIGTVLGMEMPTPNVVTGQFLTENWSDNPAVATRWWLCDSRILNQPEALINDEECFKTSKLCDDIIQDDSSGQQVAFSPADLRNFQDGLVARHRSSADLNAAYHRYRLGEIDLADWLSEPLGDEDWTLWPIDENPPVIVPRRYYRRRYTLNLYLNDTERAHDILFKTILPSFRGYLLYGPDGRIQIKTERPASSCLLRGTVLAGDTEIPVDSVEEWLIDEPVPELTNYAAAAQGAVASATSILGANFAAGYGIDGTRIATADGLHYWSPFGEVSFDNPETLAVEFNAARTINRVELFTYGDNTDESAPPTPDEQFTLFGLTDFDVEYTTDGAAWQLLPNGQVRGNSNVWRRIDFEAIEDVQGIRVKCYGGADGRARITEIEAYDTTPRLQNTKIALIGVGLDTGEARTVVDTRYSTVGNAITLAAATTGAAAPVASGATFAGGDGADTPASATVTITGTPVVGETITVTIDDVVIPYTVEAGSSQGTTAAMVAAAINADRTIRRYVKADWNTASPTVVSLKAKLGFLKLERAAVNGHAIAEEVIEVQAVFTPENVLNSTFTFPMGERQSVINRIVIKFRNSADDYAETELHVNDYAHQKLVGKINPLEIDGRGVDSYHQAYRLASSALSKLREGDFFCGWSGGRGSALLDEGDVVAVSMDGFVYLPVRIEESRIDAKLNCKFVGRLYSTLMYSDEVGQHTIPMPSSLTPLNVAPPAATMLTLDEDGYIGIDGTFHSRIKGTFTFGAYYSEQFAEIHVKGPSDADYKLRDKVTLEASDASHAMSFSVPNVEAGVNEVKIVVKNRIGTTAAPDLDGQVEIVRAGAFVPPAVRNLQIDKVLAGSLANEEFNSRLIAWRKGVREVIGTNPAAGEQSPQYILRTFDDDTGDAGRSIIVSNQGAVPNIWTPKDAANPENAFVTILPNGSLVRAAGRPDLSNVGFYSQILTGDVDFTFSVDDRYPPSRVMVVDSGEELDFTVDTRSDFLTTLVYPLRKTQIVTLLTTGTLPAPLSTGQFYYVVEARENLFKLAATPNGAVIDILDDGAGTHSLVIVGGEDPAYNATWWAQTIGSRAYFRPDIYGEPNVAIVPTDSFTMSFREGLCTYYRNFVSEESQPVYRSQWLPIPYRFRIHVAFQMSGVSVEQAIIKAQVRYKAPMTSFFYTRKMIEYDFAGIVPDNIRVEVAEQSRLPYIGSGPFESIVG